MWKRRIEGGTDSALAKYIDQAWTELGLVGADGENGLDWIVGEGRDLRVDAITSELHLVLVLFVNVAKLRSHIVNLQGFRCDALREVALNTSLLPAEERSHDCYDQPSRESSEELVVEGN